MDRRFFYVMPVEGGWEVREELSTRALSPFFVDSAAALVSAVESAREMWEKSRLASGVRVQDHQGQWRDEMLFGSGLPVRIETTARLTRQHRSLRSR